MWFIWILFLLSLLVYCVSGIHIIKVDSSVCYCFFRENGKYYYEDHDGDLLRYYGEEELIVIALIAIAGSAVLFGIIGGLLVGGFKAVLAGGLLFGPGISIGLYFALVYKIKKMRLANDWKAFCKKKSKSGMDYSKMQMPAYKERKRRKTKEKSSRYEDDSAGQKDNNEYNGQYNQNTAYTADVYFKKAISIFGLSLNFTEEELKESYKRIMKTYHPDKYQNEKPEIKKLVEEKAKEANDLKEYLLYCLHNA